MTCRDFVELIAARLDGDLDDAEVARFDQHASECAECTTYFEDYKKTIATAKQAFDVSAGEVREDPAKHLPESLIKRILDARHRTGNSKS
jgi:anti-sigma factor RsiW